MSQEKPPAADWLRQQERSNLTILKLMVWISLTFGRAIGRIVLYGIAAYFVLFSPKARRFSRNYLHRALDRWAEWSDGFRHVFSFASTIHDRIYLLNDRFDLFDIEVIGAEAVNEAARSHPGALLIGAHLGSFEVLRAVGRGREGLKVAMLMYEENARKINTTLEAINPAASEDIIPLGRMDSMLQARDKLDAGYAVGMLADRSLSDDATLDCDFLGEKAPFPLGPWRMAAMLRRPVFFMTGLYLGGNRYRLHFEPLADFTETPREERDAAIRAAMQHYADRLTHYCRQTPYNWFNFFDFWQKK
jgi:predicted LPLAT superfamily acyltransferase